MNTADWEMDAAGGERFQMRESMKSLDSNKLLLEGSTKSFDLGSSSRALSVGTSKSECCDDDPHCLDSNKSLNGAVERQELEASVTGSSELRRSQSQASLESN